MILKSIDNWMSPFLEVANIATFQHLVQVINRLQNKPLQEYKAGFSTNSNGGRFQKGGKTNTMAVDTHNRRGKGKMQNRANVAATEDEVKAQGMLWGKDIDRSSPWKQE